MSTNNESKINRLLSSHPHGVVLLSSCLVERGYSLDLLKRYKKSNWLKAIGTGAMIRSGDELEYEGAVYALQNQLGMNIHPGGKTSLALLGKAHYLELATKSITLFGTEGEKLPAWFQKYDWGLSVNYYSSNFLSSNAGFKEIEFKNFSITISSATRAMMECLYLAPEKQDLFECYELMEGLNNLRPKLVQELLEKCSSVKVKRLFIYMAEKAEHDWVKYLNLDKVDFGGGKRSFVKGGVYIPKYKITVPKELE